MARGILSKVLGNVHRHQHLPLEYRSVRVTTLQNIMIQKCMMKWSLQGMWGLKIHCQKEYENQIICGDSRNIPLPDNCVHLVVTSPPYNASKEYDENLSLSEYLTLLKDVFSECYRVLAPGGRMVVNIANLGRKPYIPLTSHVNLIMHELGFLHRGEVIWDKSASAGSSCAWGSFQSASNPCLRDIHEYLLMYSKGDYKLPRTKKEREDGRIDTIEKEEFIQQTKSIWAFSTESAKRVNHPAPFPVELPKKVYRNVHFRRGCCTRSILGFWNYRCCCKAVRADLYRDRFVCGLL